MFGIFKKQMDESDNIRPENWEFYIGQNDLKEKLQIAIEAAKQRDQKLPSVLLNGGAGYGKTTIAEITAREFGTEFKTYISTAIESLADIIEICTKAEKHSVIFLDEFQELSKSVQTTLLSVFEDEKITIKSGKNLIHIPVEPFTIIGATTDISKIIEPLRNRFGIVHTFSPYTPDELKEIAKRTSHRINFPIDDNEILSEIAKRCRGIPRNCNRLILRVRDYCQVKNSGYADLDTVNEALELEGIDENGLNTKDRQYIDILYNSFGGGPSGILSLSSIMGEKREVLEKDIEPYLISMGFLTRGSRGRSLTQKGVDYALAN